MHQTAGGGGGSDKRCSSKRHQRKSAEETEAEQLELLLRQFVTCDPPNFQKSNINNTGLQLCFSAIRKALGHSIEFLFNSPPHRGFAAAAAAPQPSKANGSGGLMCVRVCLL